jgi:hypothetical protein
LKQNGLFRGIFLNVPLVMLRGKVSFYKN